LGKLNERKHSQGQGIDGRISKLDLQEMESDGVDWIHLAQDRDKRRAVANKGMKLWVA
jgi:hypothetical protein